MKGFKRVRYEQSWNGKPELIYLYEAGKDRVQRIKWSPRGWVDDPTAESGWTNIEGKPVRRINEGEESLAKYESDLAPELAFLQDRYGTKELDVNMDDFRVCILDIEIAGGNGGHLQNERVTIKRTEDGQMESMTLAEVEEIEGFRNFYVSTGRGWAKYRDTNYSKSDFPDPLKTEYPINLITAYDSRTKKTVTFGIGQYTGEQTFDYRGYNTESSMLIAFFKWFSEQNFDIITGWNVEMFDLKYIVNRSIWYRNDGQEEVYSAACMLSPSRRINNRKIDKAEGHVKIQDTIIMDYLELYKKFTYSNETSYKLQAIGMKVCGEGKVEYEGSISTFYKKDWNKFVEYNVQDVLLVKKIDDKKRFLELAVTFAYQALVPIDRIFSAVATIEGYILRYLHQNKMVMKDRGIKKSDWWVDEDWFITKELKDPSNPKSELITVAQNVKDEEIKKCLDVWANGNEVEKEKIRETLRYHVKGGHVEANPGMYTSSICFDVASLYPHMIIQYNISPETKVTRLSKETGDKAGYIESEINGVWFKREKGILPTIVKRIFDERSSFKKKMFKEKHGSDLYNYYNSMQQVRKILINSMYGVMINEYFHFYDPDLARAITRGGRRLIRFLSDKAETACKMLAAKPQVCFPGAKPFEMKNNVLSLIDTDSNHLHFQELKKNLAPEMPEREFLAIMETYMEKAFEVVLQRKAKVKGLEQVIRFKREGVIPNELVMAKKKYISILVQNEDEIYDPPRMKTTGVEITRSDTPTWVREKMIETVNYIIGGCTEKELMEKVDQVWLDFQKQDLESICSNGSVSKYHAYTEESRPTEVDNKKKPAANPFAAFSDVKTVSMLTFMNGTPMRNKAAIAYNTFIKTKNLAYEKITDGSKIHYIPVENVLDFRNDVMAWVESCPPEIKNILKVDYKKQFQTFTGMINRICVVLGYAQWLDYKKYEKPVGGLNSSVFNYCTEE